MGKVEVREEEPGAEAVASSFDAVSPPGAAPCRPAPFVHGGVRASSAA